MPLSNAIIMAVRYRQTPLTSQQIAYFLCFNSMVRTDCLKELTLQIEQQVYHNPACFDITGELITISRWTQKEQQVVQHIFDEVQKAIRLFQQVSEDVSSCNNLVLALVLYKRLSDIKRSQQHFTPIVPQQLKFNSILLATTPAELPNRVSEVMDYIERTDNRFAGAFLMGKEVLSTVGEKQQIIKLHEVMLIISDLCLDEEQVPTSIFQVVFSRLFWNNIKKTSHWLERAGK